MDSERPAFCGGYAERPRHDLEYRSRPKIINRRIWCWGAPNFTTAPNLNLIDSSLAAAANTMLNPVSVTSDGAHLFVADLGFNRVLIWNEIPTKNQQPADVEIGQINF